MSLETFILLFVAGVLAGGVNAVAGGATLITFPILLSSGLPPIIANASNFVAVLPSNMAALPAYRDELVKHKDVAIRLSLVSLLGGAVGCMLLIYSTDEVFLGLVPWLLLIATTLLAFGKKINAFIKSRLPAKENKSPSDSPVSLAGMALIFIFAIYGGYFGAGLGVIMLAGLSILGYSEYHEANALKNLTNALISLLGVFIYAASGLIEWPYALVMMAGATIGGYGAIRISRFIPQAALSYAVITIGTALTIYYFIKYY